MKKIYSNFIGFLIGALTSVAIFVATRPPTETERLLAEVDKLTSSALDSLNAGSLGRSDYLDFSTTHRKRLSIGIAGESAIVNFGTIKNRVCIKVCSETRFIAISAPARATLLDALLARKGRLENKELVLFPNLGPSSIKLKEITAPDIDGDGLEEIIVSLRNVYGVGHASAPIVIKQDNGSWSFVPIPSFANEAKEMFKAGIETGVIQPDYAYAIDDENGKSFPLLMSSFEFVSRLHRGHVEFYGPGGDWRFISPYGQSNKSLAVLVSYGDDSTASNHRAFFKLMDYYEEGWVPNMEFNGGHPIVYADPIAVHGLTAEAFYENELAEMVGTRLPLGPTN